MRGSLWFVGSFALVAGCNALLDLEKGDLTSSAGGASSSSSSAVSSATSTSSAVGGGASSASTASSSTGMAPDGGGGSGGEGGAAPGVAWAVTLDGAGSVLVCADPSGASIWVAGAASATVDFGQGPLTTADSFYVARLDEATGEVLAFATGPDSSVGTAKPVSIVCDATGVTVAGNVVAPALGLTTGSGGFLAHYDESGATSWLRAFAFDANTTVRNVSLSSASPPAYALSGNFKSTFTIDAGATSLPVTYAGNGTYAQGFVVDFDAAGAPTDAVVISASATVVTLGTAASSSGLVVVGYGAPGLTFSNGGICGAPALASEAYLAIVAPNTGCVDSAFDTSSSVLSNVREVAAAGTSVFVAGLFQGTVGFGSSSLTAMGTSSYSFLGAFDSALTPHALVGVGLGDTLAQAQVNAIAVFPSGDLAVAGVFATVAPFASPSISAGSTDGYLARLDPATLAPIDVLSFGGPAADTATTVAAHPTKNEAFVGGLFHVVMSIGGLTITTSNSGLTGYVAALSY